MRYSSYHIYYLSRNFLTDTSLSYLELCENLEEVYLEGNVCIEDYIQCKQMLQRKVKKLKILDGKIIQAGKLSSIMKFISTYHYFPITESKTVIDGTPEEKTEFETISVISCLLRTKFSSLFHFQIWNYLFIKYLIIFLCRLYQIQILLADPQQDLVLHFHLEFISEKYLYTIQMFK